MNVKKLFSYFTLYRKYTLTTERSAESVMRTMRRICKDTSPETSEFHGKVFENRFRVCLFHDRCAHIYYRNPPILIGQVSEGDGKTTIEICARMTLFACVVFAMFAPLLALGLVFGVIALCVGDFASALPAILTFAFLLFLEFFFTLVFVRQPADRAIKRLSHLLFAEETPSSVEE